MPRAVVLGATGHIGAHVVQALTQRGIAVRAVYRNPRYRFVLDGLPIDAVQADLTDPSALRRALDGCEWVFHCAGFYPRLTDRRAVALRRAAAQARDVFDVLKAVRPPRIVYVSSAATIRSASDQPATEADREPWPATTWKPLYPTVKTAMECAVERYAQDGLPIVIVNPSICIGEYDAHAFSGQLVLWFAKGRLPVYLEHRINVVYTGDVASAMIVAADRGAVGERYLLSHRNMTLGEFARLVARLSEVRPPRWILPGPLCMTAAWMMEALAFLTRREPLFSRQVVRSAKTSHHWLDSTKAQRELGMPQTPIDEAIRRAVAWFRQHRYL